MSIPDLAGGGPPQLINSITQKAQWWLCVVLGSGEFHTF